MICNFSFSWSITRANQGEGEGGCFFRKAIRYLYCSVDEHQSSTLYLGSRYFGNFDWTGSDVTKCSWWYFEITYFQISSRRLNWEGALKVRVQNENWRNKMDNTAYKDWIWSGLLLKFLSTSLLYLTTCTLPHYEWARRSVLGGSGQRHFLNHLLEWAHGAMFLWFVSTCHFLYSMLDLPIRLARWKSICKYHAKRK